jgi:hypothetical protein
MCEVEALLFLCDLRNMSSVSGSYRPITPYVKPFFPPDPPQMTALYEFFVVLCARVSRFNHVFTL